MTSELEREALATLSELWDLSPDVRLGQLMAHLGFLGEVHVGKGLGDIDDDELIAVMVRHKAELTARLRHEPSPSVGGAISVSGSPMTVQPSSTSELAQ